MGQYLLLRYSNVIGTMWLLTGVTVLPVSMMPPRSGTVNFGSCLTRSRPSYLMELSPSVTCENCLNLLNNNAYLTIFKIWISQVGSEVFLNSPLYADDKVITRINDDELQIAVFALNNTLVEYELKISVQKSKN